MLVGLTRWPAWKSDSPDPRGWALDRPRNRLDTFAFLVVFSTQAFKDNVQDPG